MNPTTRSTKAGPDAAIRSEEARLARRLSRARQELLRQVVSTRASLVSRALASVRDGRTREYEVLLHSPDRELLDRAISSPALECDRLTYRLLALIGWARELVADPAVDSSRRQELEASLRDLRSIQARFVEIGSNVVSAVVRKYRRFGMPDEDLRQEGVIGLLRASESFDPESGTRYSTYAEHWVRQKVRRAIENRADPVRIPVHKRRTLEAVRHRASQARTTGRFESLESAAVELGHDPREFTRLARATTSVPLDPAVRVDGRACGDSRIKDAESALILEESIRDMRSKLEVLEPRDRRILELRFGLGGRVAHEARELASRLGLSRHQVDRSIRKSMASLRLGIVSRGGTTSAA